MRQGLGLASAGITCGALLSVGAAIVITRAVYGVSMADPIAWGGAVAVVVSVAAVGNIVPAWRASRLDPVVALRVE